MSVLVGFDDTLCGHDALGLGRLLSQLVLEPMLVAAVWPEHDTGLSLTMHDLQWVGEQRQRAQEMLETARTILGDSATADYQIVGPASAPAGLHSLAEELTASAIVVGSGADAAIGRLSPGSTSERLLHGAPCPVAVAPRGYRFREVDATVRTVAVAYVDSDEGREALELAASIGQRTGAHLLVLTVTERPESVASEQLANEAAEAAPGLASSVEVLTGRDVAAALAKRSEHEIDLLVCGSRGYGPVRSVLLGGVSRRLVRTAACPVLIVPRGGPRPS